ncbi:MAG: TetR/AcrR family transcriptional regulator [Treponema sp.]|nr:TetR/AcrR family transcriptional regulator [Treponema sp.]MCL2237492.1 TetR/AcrR family transcriptional regulator [Treponema sp.]
MAVAVEHDKRRQKILEKALAVFIEDGFENATFQKISDKCGITRTILYLYFKNKKDIFNYSIKQLLLNVEESINSICSDSSLSSADKISQVLLAVLKQLEQSRQLLYVVLDYLLHLSKSGANPEDRVRRRTVKLHRILSSLVNEGIKSGELKRANVKTTHDYLYGFVEAAIFQLTVLKRDNLKDLEKAVVFAVDELAV